MRCIHLNTPATLTEEFKTYIMQKVIELIDKYLYGDRFALSFSIAENEVFIFAEEVLSSELIADIERFVSSDPAAANAADPYSYVFNSYKGMRAILYYRVANHLIYSADALLTSETNDYSDYRDPFDIDVGEQNDFKDARACFYRLARKISEDAAVATGIEINPAAKISSGLVIDHGYNTKIITENPMDDHGIVIGETSEIGENCTILNGVIIGASDVNKGAKNGRRHPKIGSNVTICANARILGAVEIGDNVEIAPFAVVTRDIPSNCKVSIVNQLQIEKRGNSDGKLVIYGLIPVGNDLLISGKNLSNCTVCFCDSETFTAEIDVNVIEITDSIIKFRIINFCDLPERPSICIKCGNTRLYLLQPNAVNAITGKDDEKDG